MYSRHPFIAKFHEIGIPKWQRITGYALSIVFSIQLFMPSVLKVIQEADIMEEEMTGTHVEQGMPPASLMGIVMAMLYDGTVLRNPSMLK